MRFPALLVATLVLLPAAAVLGAEPVVGQHHPDLRLPTIDGTQTLDLRELRGKRVLLIQFASW